MIQPDQTTPPLATFRARNILGVVTGAVILGVLSGAGVVGAAGWAEGRAIASGAVGAGLVWLVAGLLGVQALVVGTGLSVDRLGFGVLAASMARMLMALLLGILVYFLIGFDGRSFWVCFLGAGIAALAAESLWAVRVINSTARASGARPSKHGGV